MLWRASCLCFFGLFRMSEAVVPSERQYDPEVHLSFGDVKVKRRSQLRWLEVHIKVSKTDRFCHGVSIYVGAKGGILCPVTAVLAFLVQWGTKEESLFQFKNGQYLTRTGFVAPLRYVFQKAGIVAENHSGHSFRTGAPTTASQ